MLRLTPRRHGCWHSHRLDNNYSWARLIFASKRIHRRILVYLLAHNLDHLRNPNPPRRHLQPTKVHRTPPLLKTRFTHTTNSLIIPIRKQDSKPQHKNDYSQCIEINKYIPAQHVGFNQNQKRPDDKKNVHA